MLQDKRHDGVAFDLEIPCCGRMFSVPRSLGLLRRLESEFGPLTPFCHRLDARSVSFDDLVRLIEAVLRDVAGAPERADVQKWLFSSRGADTCGRQLAMPLLTLRMSDEEVEIVRQRQLDAIARSGRTPRPEEINAAEGKNGPFATMAG